MRAGSSPSLHTTSAPILRSGGLVLFVLALPLIVAATAGPPQAPAPASLAVSPPAAALPVVDEHTYLEQIVRPHRGRVLVVNFWASWCSSCLVELPALARAQQAQPPGTVDVVLVSADSGASAADDATSALAKLGVPLSTFLHTGEDPLPLCRLIDDAWRGELPYTVVYDAEGRVSAKLLGEQEEATFRRVIAAALAQGRPRERAPARR